MFTPSIVLAYVISFCKHVNSSALFARCTFFADLTRNNIKTCKEALEHASLNNNNFENKSTEQSAEI